VLCASHRTALDPHDGAQRFEQRAAGELDLVEAIKELSPGLRIFVIGHAAPTEDDPEALASKRANVVADALASAGIERARIESHSAGASDPVYGPSGTDDERSRRVDFDLSHVHARERAWGESARRIDYVPPPDLPCN
jgi:hypothetical protein